MPVVARSSWRQGWRHVLPVVNETARADAGGAPVSNDNDMTLPVAPLRAARGTGIYKQFPPPVWFATVSTIAIYTHTHYRSLRSNAYCIDSTCTSRKLHVTLNKSLNGHM